MRYKKLFELFDSELHFFFLVIISLQNSGPCNSFHCLGHFKNVYDDDDDDDEMLWLQFTSCWSPVTVCRQRHRWWLTFSLWRVHCWSRSMIRMSPFLTNAKPTSQCRYTVVTLLSISLYYYVLYSAIQPLTGASKKKVKVAHTRLPSVGFQSWSRFLAVSLQVTWVINPAIGCHYFPPGLQLPPQPLRGLLPVSLLGEQRHDGCEQFA